MAHIRQGFFSGGIRDVTIHGGTFVDVHGSYQVQSNNHETRTPLTPVPFNAGTGFLEYGCG